MTICRQTIPSIGFYDHKYVLWYPIFTSEWTENSSAVRTASYGALKIADFHTFLTKNGMTTCRQTIPLDGFYEHKYILWHPIFTLEWEENSYAVRTTSYGSRKIGDFQDFFLEAVWQTVDIQYDLTTSPATHMFIKAQIWCYWQRKIRLTFVAWSAASAKWPIFRLFSTYTV